MYAKDQIVKTNEAFNRKKYDILKKTSKFIQVVRNPKIVCKKCASVADKKKWLHKPASLR
jgi:hypothetical protein